MPLDPQDHAERVALFRSEIVGQLCHRELDHGELRRILVDLSQQRYRPPDSDITRTFSIPTLERWYYAYRKGGLPALRPAPRSDRGRALGLPPALREMLLDIRREHPSAGVPLILRTLIADGRLDPGTISAATLRRLYGESGLDKIALRDGAGQKLRLRWQAERPGALWHGDVCHGPTLVIDGQRRPLRIHALLDDASRYVVALEAHHAERELEMLGLLVRALRRHGAPDALYLDNGATYRGEALRLGCERLGITLLHARPYDAPARGKMERFWRTLREGCLDHFGSITSLDDVNLVLSAFVEEHYHKAPHAGLIGRSPAVVFAAAPPAADAFVTEDKLRDALTVRERRRVHKDSTLSVDGVDWELDQAFLAGRVVTVARSLIDGGGEAPWVEYEGRRLVLHRVDPEANARRKRPRRRADETTTDKRAVAFEPSRALVERGARRKDEPGSKERP